MLKITKLADYATVLMHWLSTHADGHYSAALIASDVGMALPTVSKILKQLNAAGLVKSTRGSQGGYHLARDAGGVSLAEIITAIDGEPAMTECSQSENCCQYDHQCEIRGNWQYINKLVYDVLNNVSIKDMTHRLADTTFTGVRHVSE